MRESEMAKLLALAATVDNRVVTPEQVGGWMAAIGGLDFEASVRALHEHRRSSPDYLQPAHIAALVAAEDRRPDRRAEQAERAALAAFCEYTGVPAVEAAEHWNDRAWLAEQVDVARKAYRQRALEAGA